MGFTSGFTGGVTLTLGIAYLTVLAHERNRQSQGQALRAQSRVLTSLLEPAPIQPPQTRSELAREERSTLVEAAKDRWNNEIEGAVRWVQRTNWDEVREGAEGTIARLLGGGLEKSREGIEAAEKHAGPIASEALAKSRELAQKGADRVGVEAQRLGEDAKVSGSKIATAAKEQASRVGGKSVELKDSTAAHARATGSDLKEAAKSGYAGAKDKAQDITTATKKASERAAATAREQASRAGETTAELKDAAKAKTDTAVAETKSGAQGVADSIRRSGGTVDAARGAVREFISDGIEKGKEALGKAQAAIGIAEHKISSSTAPSAVEKALQERYTKPDGLNKSVEEALEERYKPVEARDNTVLRGV